MKINLLLLLSTTKTKCVFAFLLFALLFLSIGTNSAQAQAFRTTWITTDGQIIIPTTGTGYNYNITWTNLTNTGVGNGSATAVTTNNFTITGLQNNSTYEIAITGAFPRFFMNNNATEKTKLRTIEEWGNIAWTSMAFAFDGCSNLTYGTSVDNPNLSGVNSLRSMFAGCTNFNGNIGGWNTSTITSMRQMFFQASSFNQNIGSWNTGAVTDMYFMFGSATSFNQNIGNWNTGAVTNMSSMFSGALSFNWNIGNWNISSIVQQSFSDGMAFMLSQTGLSTANYDAILTGWAAQNVGTGIDLGAGQQRYCNAVAARNTLTSTPRNWIISGDIPSCGAEINLQGNGNNIPSGTTTTSAVRDTDFGNVLECGTNTITKTFTIQNKGASALTITGITITGTNAADFSLGTIPTTVAIGDNATFTVTFNPSAIGNRTATINIANNDADENPYTFAINGNGTIGTSSEIFVRQIGGNDANAGTSFATAFATLQKALENACVGAKIYVAKGTYKPSQQYNFSTGNPSTGDVRAASFKISDGVEVYGGFAGTETGAITQAVLDARDFSSNTTILSGDLLGNDVVTGTFPTLSYTNYADNVYHVVFTKNVSTATKVNGVTIKSGNANIFENSNGAGWYNNGEVGVSSPTLTNCSFYQNNAGSGGGMYNNRSAGSSNPILTNCSFYQNNANAGGGICTGGAFGSSSLILTNCSFSQNNAPNSGGGIYTGGFLSSSNVIITNCSFSQNNAPNGGGMVSEVGVNNIIRNSIFWGNTGNGKSWNNAAGGTVNIAYSLVEETQATITSGVYAPTTVGAGMVYTQNPLFVNAANGDLSLQAGSPAIDTGNDADIPSGVTTDLAGNTRIQGTRVDMGAYERLVLAPEINLVGNGNNIVSGTTSTTSTNDTDFGNVLECGTNTISKTFTIQNTGSAVLNITGITITGTNAADFSLGTTPTTVAAGGNTTFTVTFNPSVIGNRVATISIANNDSNENPYTFAINGNGTIGTSSEIFVRQIGGNDANAGTSFATAFATLQKALENACVGAKIYVAKGTYKPSQQYNFSTGNPSTGDIRAASFKIPDGVEVYGGFAGTETGAITQAVLDARDFSSNTTILSGDLLGNDVVTGTFPTLSYTNYADNVYHVVFTKNVSTATKVNGVTIKSGNANIFPNSIGAGWYNDGEVGVSNPTLTNCSFYQNNATDSGGGMYNNRSSGSSNPILTNCSFYQNNANVGGGMSNGGSFGSSSPILTNCSFYQNNANGGGGIYTGGFLGSCNVIITNCSFYQNNANGSGGGMVSEIGNNIIRNSIFWGNTGNGKSWNNAAGGTVNIAYSLVEETQATITSGVYVSTTVGVGMVYTQNPLFVNAANGDLSLQAGSPAVDAGNDADIPSGITTDLAGNTRIQGTRVDMGAYERLVLAPEINLVGNGNNIVSGTTSTTSTNDTDFGNVLECGTNTISKTFTIQNIGSAVLNITGITITGTNAADFSLGTTPTTVAAGGNATFTVTFNPSVIGNRVATINIANNDSDENPYTFAINGNGTADNVNPVIPTLANVTAQCSVTSLTAPTTTDNCSGTITGTTAQTFPITSTTVVTWTFTDASGNSVTTNQNVIINDNTNPVVPTLANVTSACSVTSLTAPTTTDNCSGTITGITTQTFPITTSTTVVWRFQDAAGNFVTANQNVVINDNVNPAIPTLANITSACSVASLVAPTTTDNCSGTITGTTAQTFPITSSTTVVWTFTDAAGNFVTANQNVVINDNTNPVIPTLANVTVQCSVASIPAPTTTDNCSGTITGTTTQTFPITTSTTVVWRFQDAAGNFVTANQNVVINDNVNPAIPTLTNVTSACSVASLVAPTTTDNCSGTITGTTTQTFPITAQGTTVVTWRFQDAAGNFVTANQNVIINDNVNPVIPTLANVTSACSVASLTAPTTTDNCSGTITGTTTQTFPITTSTTVVWTFTDASGNSVTANQNVVINDNVNPAIPTLTNVTSACLVASLVAPTTTDNCSGTITGTTTQTFPITTSTTVVWTFTDASGNSVTANQNVVINDNVNPATPTLANVTSACSVASLVAPTTTDNCSGTITGTTTQTFPITTSTTVVWTFTDASGNSVTANQNVIINDNVNPTITAPTNVTANTNATLCTASGITLGTPTGSDNCGTVTFSNNAPTIFPIGTTTVTWTANDGNGNTATATQLVTVVEAREINVLGNGISIVDGDITPSLSDNTNFGDVFGGRSVIYTLQNTGTEAILISSITSNNVNFSITGVPTSIAAGTSATFSVTFANAILGLETATITINNNDCNEGVYDFAIQATGVTTPPPPPAPVVPINANLVLVASSFSNTKINLSWTRNERATAYILYRNDRVVGQFSATTANYSDENLTSDTFYQYKLIAVIDNRDSAPSVANEWTYPAKPTLNSVATLCQEGNAFVSFTSTGEKHKVYIEEVGGNPIAETTTHSFELPLVTTTSSFYVSTVGRVSLKESERTKVEVVVQPIFDAIILGDDLQISCGANLALEAQQVQNADSYTWLLNGFEIGTGSTFVATNSGNYQVRVKKGVCTFISAKVNVQLNQTPIARITQPNGIRFCDRGTVTAAQTNANASYEWLLNNAVVGQGTSISVTQSGVYTLRVTQNGCQASTTVEVIISDTPSLPVLVATQNSICPNTETTLSVQNIENGITYQWFRNGRNLRQTGTSFTTSIQGNYQVRAFVIGNTTCSILSETLQITRFATLPIYLRISEDRKSLFLEDANLSQNEIASVEWYFEGELKTDLGSNFEITPTENGNYSARVTNQNGCIIQTTVVYFRLITSVIVTGEEDLKEGIFNIYPNPSSGIFKVQFGTSLSENIQVTIFDGIGRKVTTTTFEKGNQEFTINIQNMPSGVYLIHFNKNNNTYTRQIIIE